MISSLKSKFDILPRRLLLIGSDKLAVYHWNKGRITQSYLFDTEETGRQQFERYMAATAADNLYILIDVAEEEFRQEMIPHVFGSDREAVLERKQGRLFRNSQYYYSEIQDREKEGRRDDQVLLTAITNTALVKPWLEIIEKVQGADCLYDFNRTVQLTYSEFNSRQYRQDVTGEPAKYQWYAPVIFL